MKKRLLTFIMILATVFGIFAIANKEVKANTTDDSKEKWSAIGTIEGSNWNKDFPLNYNSKTDRYEVVLELKANNEFKIRLNNSWSKSIGYGGKTGDGISTYLSNAGGNFKVKSGKDGMYVLWVKDDKVANYGDMSYGFGIDVYVEEIKYFNVTHYTKDGSVLSTTEVKENSGYTPAFAEVEGFKLEGWYTDSALTNKLEKDTPITSDIHLYPKYVEAEDYVIYLKDEAGVLGTSAYVYLFRGGLDGGEEAAWPGTKLEKDDERGYIVNIDASKSSTMIIFNGGNGKPQTIDLSLTAEAGDTYVLGEKSNDKYSANVEKTGALYALQDLTKTFYNNGVYTRSTEIFINKEAISNDYATHFHNPQGGENVLLNRTTEFVGDYLYFVETKVGFGTNAEGKLTQFTWNGSYDHSESETNAIEEAFYTLYDLMNNSAEWTYADGVYTTTDATVIKMAEGFTAPGWISPDTNYTSYTQVTVEVVEGKLVISLWVSVLNEGIVTSTPVGNNALFSQAIIG